ncbi:MAG: sulfotransferase family protein [Anaerolineales bacterium]|nr:sulfotransferase family protein [Anaerolineales bacterium]
MTQRICLWSGPRNISTALMYSFAQRNDTTVVDEPLYAHYLSTTEAHTYHPGAADVIAVQENDGVKVVRDVILGDYPTPLVFFKHMTHHLVNLDWSFLDQTINILLTRDPRDMLPSYAKNVEQPTLRDTDYADHLKLLDYLRSRGQTPPVLDAKQVLLNPRGVLTRLCVQIGIPFEEAMLSWKAGARPEDGVWAKYWYHAVHQSTGFQPYQPKTTPFPEHLQPLLAECQPYYEQLAALAIQTDEV